MSLENLRRSDNSESTKGIKILKPKYTPLPERSELDPYLRGEVHRIDPINMESEEPSQYLTLLKINSSHFAGIYLDRGEEIAPLNLDRFRTYLRHSHRFPLVARNQYGEILGYATIGDREHQEHQHNHFIERLVVINEMQGEKNPAKTGRSFLRFVTNYAFDNPDYFGKSRNKLAADVVMFVPGWEKVSYLFLMDLGFTVKHVSPDQIDVFIHADEKLPDEHINPTSGRFLRRPTMGFESGRKQWFVREADLVREMDEHRAKYGVGPIKDETRIKKLEMKFPPNYDITF